MPLHLLGKKSWNVYNPANIERVRRDEAQAKAQEEEEERLMQEADAERRIQILRGERPSTPPPPPPAPSARPQERKSHTEDAGRFRKRRRLAGEDDTDRDIRFAQEDAQLALDRRAQQAAARSSDAPLHDSTGHIDLFPSEAKRKPVEKNAEAEKEAKDKKRELEDQYTMRFSNAAGFRQSVGQDPWYSSSQREGAAAESMPSKDVWGNEDPLRRGREKARMDANDPLAAMRKGVRQLKTVEQERKRWNEERSRELEALKASEKHRSSHRSRRSPSQDSIEGFRLDASPDRRRDDKDGRSRRHHRHRRDRSRDRSHRRTSRSDSRSHRSHHDRHHRHRDSRRHDEDSRSRR